MKDSQNCSISGVPTRRFLRDKAIFSVQLHGEQEYGGQWFEYRMTCVGCNRHCCITFQDSVISDHFEPFAYAETVAGVHFSLCKKLDQAEAKRSVRRDGQSLPMFDANNGDN